MNELPETVRHIIHRLTGKIFPGKNDQLRCAIVIDYSIDEIDETPSSSSLRRDPPTSTDLDAFASNTSIAVPPLRKSMLSSNSNLADSLSTNGLTFGKYGKNERTNERVVRDANVDLFQFRVQRISGWKSP